MDPCVTSCGLTLKVRAVPELAVPSAVETGLSESMMRGVSGQGRGGEGKFGPHWFLPSTA